MRYGGQTKIEAVNGDRADSGRLGDDGGSNGGDGLGDGGAEMRRPKDDARPSDGRDYCYPGHSIVVPGGRMRAGEC